MNGDYFDSITDHDTASCLTQVYVDSKHSRYTFERAQLYGGSTLAM